MSSVKGNPQIDLDVLSMIKSTEKLVKASAKNLDDKTLADIASYCHSMLSIASKYQGVRQTQRTSIVGGGRRKR
jgi:hypothetical protein